MKRNAVREMSYVFALRIIGLARQLRERREYQLASQLLRSGTSIGANVEEAQAATSRPDFVAKMSIASKEARETHYWLRLLRDSSSLPCTLLAPALAEVDGLTRILTAIVKTGQTRR